MSAPSALTCEQMAPVADPVRRAALFAQSFDAAALPILVPAAREAAQALTGAVLRAASALNAVPFAYQPAAAAVLALDEAVDALAEALQAQGNGVITDAEEMEAEDLGTLGKLALDAVHALLSVQHACGLRPYLYSNLRQGLHIPAPFRLAMTATGNSGSALRAWCTGHCTGDWGFQIEDGPNGRAYVLSFELVSDHQEACAAWRRLMLPAGG